jgi:hypothetical protein
MAIDFDSSYLIDVGEDDPESVVASGVEFVTRMYSTTVLMATGDPTMPC